MERISYLLASVQRCLFPYLLEEIGELSEKERRFVLVLEVVEIEKHVRNHHWLGRTPKDRPECFRGSLVRGESFLQHSDDRGAVGAFENGQVVSPVVRLGV